MSFSENPYIDEASKNSERSEWRFKEYFSQSNGFICRPDVPDKGCDFDVELIVEGASDWRFPVQMKSIEHLQVINNGQLISYSFETSRLGYLMRRIPAMGIIILYSVKEDRCYFDYADKIYQRIADSKRSDEWRENKNINIHIPITNVLTKIAAKELFQIMKSRFEQAMKMQRSHGAKYGLPTEGLATSIKYDFTNITDIISFLNDYGILLLNNYDLGIIYQMISKIPNVFIYASKELLLTATVSFSECGMYSDSELYLRKLQAKKLSFSDNEALMLKFASLKNKLALGYLSENDFLSELNQLQANDNAQNNITIQINLIRYELMQIESLAPLPTRLLQSINEIFEKILLLNSEERTKGLLTIWNAQNLSQYISHLANLHFGEIRIKESLNNPLSYEQRKQMASQLVTLENKFYSVFQTIYTQASESADKLLQAYSLLTEVEHFIHQQINYVSFEFPVDQLGSFESRIKTEVAHALTAYNFFSELTLQKDMYDSLYYAIEIIELANHAYNIKVDYNIVELYTIKKQLENAMDIKERYSVFIDLVNKKKRNEVRENQNGGMPIMEKLSDSQIEALAKNVLSSFNLPEERLINIINEMKAYRMFHQRCKDENIMILQFRDYNEPTSNSYNEPIRFILRSKSTGLETPPNSDMDLLLSSFGF